MGIDLENAYGREYRSACMEAAMKYAPKLEKLRCGGRRLSQHVNGKEEWTSVSTEGGWQRESCRCCTP